MTPTTIQLNSRPNTLRRVAAVLVEALACTQLPQSASSIRETRGATRPKSSRSPTAGVAAQQGAAGDERRRRRPGQRRPLLASLAGRLRGRWRGPWATVPGQRRSQLRPGRQAALRMTYIPDLAAVSYTGLKGPIRAVGWLESSHHFSRGSVEPEFARRLMALVKRPISAFFHLGMHWCGLCAVEGKPGPDCRSSQAVLLVPASNCVYETPIWIGHYVLGHSYQPPDEFCRAVKSCPEAGSDEFRSALVAHLPELSSSGAPEDFPFFAEWADGAQRTLQPDPEYGSEKRFLDSVAREVAPTRDQTVEEHGGLSTAACAWAGCENRALADMAICLEHAYPRFAE